VLAGRWQDAQVAAHVLYGALVGLIIAALFLVAQWFQASRGSGFSSANEGVGLSARYWMSDVLNRAYNAAEFGLVVVFAIFCFRAVCRKDWIASLAAAVLFSLAESDVWQGNMLLLNFLFFMVIFTLLVFVLLRLGLVSTMAALFFVNLLLRIPGAQGLTKPYESAVITYPALLVAIVIWAFWRTSGQQLMTVTPEDR
jgi:hypothetical protein